MVGSALPLAELPGAALSRRERQTLRAAMDRIIPAEGRMPAASGAGCEKYAHGVLAGDEQLRGRVLGALAALGPGFASRRSVAQTAALAQLEQADGAAFAALRDVVYEAYYTNPAIARLVGYDFRTGPAPTATLAPFDERVVARVRATTRLYRPA